MLGATAVGAIATASVAALEGVFSFLRPVFGVVAFDFSSLEAIYCNIKRN